MARSAFDDKTKPPGEPELARTLGKTYALWTLLLARLGTGDARAVFPTPSSP